MYKTYILFSNTVGKYYIGHTKNLENRFLMHNRGLVKSTKNGNPWKIVYTGNFENKNEAYKRELKIKSYKKGNAFKKLLT